MVFREGSFPNLRGFEHRVKERDVHQCHNREERGRGGDGKQIFHSHLLTILMHYKILIVNIFHGNGIVIGGSSLIGPGIVLYNN